MERPKILIVDDEPSVVRAFVENLQEQPYEILTAFSALKGLDLLRKEKIDLAIVDFKMPRMTGIELLQQAKKEKIQTNIVILTGFGSLELGVVAMKEGSIDVLEKPVGREEFLNIIKEYMPTQDIWRDSLETFLEQNYKNASLCFNDVLEHFHFSKTSGYALFKRHLGKPFRKRLTEIRLGHVEALLPQRALSITEIAYDCGFSSLSRLCEVFKKKYGCSPSHYRKKMNELDLKKIGGVRVFKKNEE